MGARGLEEQPRQEPGSIPGCPGSLSWLGRRPWRLGLRAVATSLRTDRRELGIVLLVLLERRLEVDRVKCVLLSFGLLWCLVFAAGAGNYSKAGVVAYIHQSLDDRR